MLEKGVKAPDFTLLNQEGEPVSLSGFLTNNPTKGKVRSIEDLGLQ